MPTSPRSTTISANRRKPKRFVVELKRCTAQQACLKQAPQLVVGGNGVSGAAFVDNARFREYVFATFKAQVESRRSRWRLWFAIVILGPTVLMTVAWTVSGQYALASIGSMVVLGYLAFGGLIHVLTKPAAKEKGPASSSNAGP